MIADEHDCNPSRTWVLLTVGVQRLASQGVDLVFLLDRGDLDNLGKQDFVWNNDACCFAALLLPWGEKHHDVPLSLLLTQRMGAASRYKQALRLGRDAEELLLQGRDVLEVAAFHLACAAKLCPGSSPFLAPALGLLAACVEVGGGFHAAGSQSWMTKCVPVGHVSDSQQHSVILVPIHNT